jgi:membrane protein implicated in regulation of membrane protease activity
VSASSDPASLGPVVPLLAAGMLVVAALLVDSVTVSLWLIGAAFAVAAVVVTWGVATRVRAHRPPPVVRARHRRAPPA